MRTPETVSPEFLAAARAERDSLLKHLAAVRAETERLEEALVRAQERHDKIAASIRAIEEVAGLAPQMAILEISEELRGERLRQVALEVIERLGEGGVPIHYRKWFDALVAEGYRVHGKDPLATFLTHVTRIDRVKPVGRRSGLYRLSLAA